MIKQLVRPSIANLVAYSSARDEFEDSQALDTIFIDANENPFDNGVNRYPDPHQKQLKRRIAEIKNVSVEQILLGNGSDEVLDLLFRAFCEPAQDEIITTPPTYGMYKVLAAINNIKNQEVILNPDFSLDADAIINAIQPNTKIIFLCSPNNPTANNLTLEAIRKILIKAPCLVLVDEAYIDFSSQPSCITLLDEYPNLIVCQTLSKAFGMAGIRLGMGFASQEIISVLKKLKPPYNINELTQQKALELLSDLEAYHSQVQILLLEKDRLIEELKTISFITKIYPSEANFILLEVDDANKRYQEIKEKGIIVRNRTKEIHCTNCLRFTIGTPDENTQLLAVLKMLA